LYCHHWVLFIEGLSVSRVFEEPNFVFRTLKYEKVLVLGDLELLGEDFESKRISERLVFCVLQYFIVFFL